MALLSFLIFRTWLRSEESYLSDIPFLMGIFFLSITFGKVMDILVSSVYYQVSDSMILIISKIRYIAIIASAAPLLFLGLGILLYIRDWEMARIKKVRKKALLLVVGAEVLINIILPSLRIAQYFIFAVMVLPLIFSGYVFLQAGRLGRLKQISPKIVGGGMILYTITQFLRIIFLSLFGLGVEYAFYSEIADLSAFVVIFTGLVRKSS